MATPVKLKVENKEVKSTEVTYDDLVILYQQYIDAYGEVPVYSKCDSKHNMPQHRIINKVLLSKNVTYDDFILQFKNDKKDKLIQQQIEKYKQIFPINVDNMTYNIFGNIDVIHGENKHNKYFLNIIDSDGYKYYCQYNSFINAIKNNQSLNKFFGGNKYTYDNINLYLLLNNIDLYVNSNNLPVSNYARENIKFFNSQNEEIEISWNHLYKMVQDGRDSSSIKQQIFLSKDEASKIIYSKQKYLNRPLLQSDFENILTSKDSISMRVIYRIWGTFNNMIEDLGLEKHDAYFKPNSKNYLSHDEIMNAINNVCQNAKSEKRNIILYEDFDDYGINVARIKRHCSIDNTSLEIELQKYGCKLQKAGNGFNYTFSDGEKVVSNYEFIFSKYLRDLGLKYNQDYFRDIPYSHLDYNYSGKMNCDYQICINNHIFYVELAGILGNDEHQRAYLSNTPIKSKSKELYRQKLNKKKDLFESNGLEYYILLPKDMNIKKYNIIFEKYLKEVA